MAKDGIENLGELTNPGAIQQSLALGNQLLDRLPLRAVRNLGPALEHVALKCGELLYGSSRPAEHLYFPVDSLISLVGQDRRGRRLALHAVGREGMVGAAGILGLTDSSSFIEAEVEISGSAWRLAVGDLNQLLADHPHLRSHLLQRVQSIMDEIVQTAIATGHATIEQRVARWLLLAASRTGNHQLHVTHQRLSEILAVRRSGVTVALHVLEGFGAIKCCRELVRIADRDRLQKAANGFA
jgi:CRP-like cAMP-binding protein